MLRPETYICSIKLFHYSLWISEHTHFSIKKPIFSTNIEIPEDNPASKIFPHNSTDVEKIISVIFLQIEGIRAIKGWVTFHSNRVGCFLFFKLKMHDLWLWEVEHIWRNFWSHYIEKYCKCLKPDFGFSNHPLKMKKREKYHETSKFFFKYSRNIQFVQILNCSVGKTKNENRFNWIIIIKWNN